jgi:hypothetical protein
MKPVTATLPLFLACAVAVHTAAARAATVVAYPLPACHDRSGQLTVTAGGEDVPVTAFTGIYDYAHFSHAGPTEITLTAAEPVTACSISPLSHGIKGEIKGNSVTFTLDRSRYLIIKINNLRELALAADDLETAAPPPSGRGIFNITAPPYNAAAAIAAGRPATAAVQSAIDDAAAAAAGGCVYVPAGVWPCGNLVLKSNVALYLAGGAVIRGTGSARDYAVHYRKKSLGMDVTRFIVTAKNTANIKIFGRGMIDGNGTLMRERDKLLNNLFVPHNCDGVEIDGVIFRDSGLWGVIPTRCKNVVIKNTKHFNENDKNHEDDAIDIQESGNVLVRHTIAISEDDTYSTKTWKAGTDIARGMAGRPLALDKVMFDDCVAWSRCAAFKVGFGVEQPQSNIIFQNACAYRSMRAIAVNRRWGDAASPAANIVFRNIDIEGFMPRSGTAYSCWLEISNGCPGALRNIAIQDCNIRRFGRSTARILGNGPDALVDGVLFQNNTVDGQPAGTLAALGIGKDNTHVRNIIFK